MITAPSRSLYERDPSVDIGSWIAEHWPRRRSRTAQHVEHRHVLSRPGVPARDHLDRIEQKLHHAVDEKVHRDRGLLQLYREVRWSVLPPGDDWTITSSDPCLEDRGMPVWRDELETYLARRPEAGDTCGVLCTVEALTVPAPPSWSGA